MADSLGQLETAVYRGRFDDGLLDVFIGAALLWVGAVSASFDDLAGLAALVPAALATPFAARRGRFIERRAGYVRFSEARRDWERSNLLGYLVVVGVAVFAVAVASRLVSVSDLGARDVAGALGPSLVAAVAVGVVAAASRLPRLMVDATLLVAGGIGVAVLDASPGVPLVAVGAIVAVRGAVLTARFIRAHPNPA